MEVVELFTIYLIPIFFILFSMIQFLGALVNALAVGTEYEISKQSKTIGFFINLVLAILFAIFAVYDLVNFNNEYGFEFLISLVGIQILNIFTHVFASEKKTEASLVKCLINIVNALYIAFGIWIFIL